MAEADDDRIERTGSGRRESDKPSTWSDPRTWMTLCGLLLAFLGYVSKQLSDINGGIQALGIADAHKTEQIAQLVRDVKDLKDDRKADAKEQTAYNFNMSKSATEMATTLKLRGLPVPNIPDPPKLGGQ